MCYTVWVVVVHTVFRMCYHITQLLVDVCVLAALGEEQLLSCHMAPNLTTLPLRHHILISSAANSTPVAFPTYLWNGPCISATIELKAKRSQTTGTNVVDGPNRILSIEG